MKRFFRYPWIVVGAIAAITVFFAAQLPRVRIDNNNYRFVPETEEARIISDKIDETFGSQVVVLVALERRYGTVLEADFIAGVRALEEKVLELPLVDEVKSIVSSDYIDGSSDAITVTPLVPDDFAGTGQELEALKDRLLSWDLYRRSLVSDDYSATQLLVRLKVPSEDAGNADALATQAEIGRLAEEAELPGTRVYITGMSVISGQMNASSKKDLRALVPLVLAVVVLVLFLSFRRLGGVLMPTLSVLISTIWAVGAMPLFGVNLTILGIMIPVILVAIGTAYAIHVVSHYYDEIADGRPLEREEHRETVFATLRTVGAPVLLAALTTFAGFASLCFTAVVPIREFGIFSSLGVLVSFAVALTLVPALLLIRGPDPKGDRRAGQAGGEDKLSAVLADALSSVSRKRRSVVWLTAAAVVLSLTGISRLVVDNVFVEYFQKDSPIVASDDFVRGNFGGSKTVSLIVTGKERGDVLRPDVLSAMDGLAAYLAADVPEVGKVSAFTDLVKRVNQVFNADESPDGIPAATASAADPLNASEPGAFGFDFIPQAADSAPADGGARGESDGQDKAGNKEFPPVDERRVAELLERAAAAGSRRNLSGEELVRGIAEAINYRGASYYEIPADPERYGKRRAEELKGIVSNYLALLSADISSYADDALEPLSICMNVQLRTVGQIDSGKAITAIRGYVAERFPKDVTVELGGTALVEETLNRLVVGSQLSSVASSLLMVFLILAVYYRSVAAGLIGLVPLAVSILVNFGVMGAFGIKLNIGTALVASIAVGIGIDYTIHYLAAYRREYLAANGAGGYLRRTFLSSGKAIIFNAASVGAGFAVLLLSSFTMLQYLGILISLTMATSSLVSLTLLPILLETTRPAFIRRPQPGKESLVSMEVTQ